MLKHVETSTYKLLGTALSCIHKLKKKNPFTYVQPILLDNKLKLGGFW